jgi:hypothetical protein
MPVIRRTWWSAALLALLASCSGGAGTSTGPSPTLPRDVSGRWTGRAVSITGGAGSFTATLTQSGSAVEGSMRGDEPTCIGGGKLTASLVGDRLEGDVVAGDVRVTLYLTVSGDDQIDGTYDIAAAAGVCPRDRGSMTLTRVR